MVNVLHRQKVLRRPEQVPRTNRVVITAKTAALPAFISFKPLAFLTGLWIKHLLDNTGFVRLFWGSTMLGFFFQQKFVV